MTRDTPSDLPRVLVVAEAANPEWASVPLIGWSLYEAMARRFPCHLVTQIRNREALLRAGLVEGQDFTAIDSEAVAGKLWALSNRLRLNKEASWTIVAATRGLAYPTFERLIWKQFGSRIRAGEFDVVHRITPVTQSAVGPLARRVKGTRVPFVLGPLNGGVPWPDGFEAEKAREGERFANLRKIIKVLPGRGRMMRAASAIIAASRSAKGDVPAALHDRTLRIPENAVDPARFSRRAVQDGASPLRACFIGRFVPCKGLDMLLEAAAPLLSDGRMQLDLIGDGPEMPRLREICDRLSLSDGVTFHGWLEHAKVQDIAVSSHVLTFPSIRDFGGGAVLEAMALGVVPIIVDYAGPAELVTPETGFSIPLGPRPDVIAALAKTLTDLCDDPSPLAPMAAACIQEVEQRYTWDAKAAQFHEIYDWVLGRTSKKPTLGFGD